MDVYLTKWMARFVRREGISHAALRDAILRAERGLIDADLGGGLIKQRVARAGKGRSGGYRTIIAYRRGDRAFFIHGFAKSEQENICPDELRTAREIGAVLMATPADVVARNITTGEWEEIAYGREEEA
ncbi:MAG TPA: type II toxin-antitoxin system RelE/ParE family toxin [Terracidiphilus sp.]|nr:type II toxin-antitoxin system RelE/ParE family toxin [Terracidiphilus sp.]